MSSAQKEVIYTDIDDEITSLIEKVTASDSKIVALVLPKRPSVLQSIVNMKLLKRTADELGKRIVLITSEAGLLPLAGAVGIHVAKTLQSKPAVPAAPNVSDSSMPIDAEVVDLRSDEIDKNRTVGELAGLSSGAASMGSEADHVIDLNDEPETTAKPTMNKKLRVPNFEKFRFRLLLGGLVLLLLIGSWLYAVIVLPKAKVTIKTDTSAINSDINFVASTAAKEYEAESKLLPATAKQLKKTDTEKIAASGQKDVGEKAKGTVKIYNCNAEDKQADIIRTVPAGTGLSTGGLTYILQTDVEVEPSRIINGNCQYNMPSEAAIVVAQNAGDKYNLSERTRAYSVAGFSTMSADGSTMTGGTTKVVKVVSQQDVDTAKQKLLDRASNTATEELTKELKNEGLVGIADTLTTSEPVIKSTPNVGEEASEVVVTIDTRYSITSIKKDDLKKLVEADASQKINNSQQVILENGLDEAVVKLVEKRPNSQVRLNVQSVVIAGPQLDPESIKRDIAGKKRGETQRLIQSRPGTRDVTIDYSPWFVNSTPKKLQKITVVFEQNDNSNR